MMLHWRFFKVLTVRWGLSKSKVDSIIFSSLCLIINLFISQHICCNISCYISRTIHCIINLFICSLFGLFNKSSFEAIHLLWWRCLLIECLLGWYLRLIWWLNKLLLLHILLLLLLYYLLLYYLLLELLLLLLLLLYLLILI